MAIPPLPSARCPLLPAWVTAYRSQWLQPDVLAGLTTAAVVLPKAMAFATIAGLPVQVGLTTALVPMVVYALLGTSRVLSVSTTTTLAILVGTELAGGSGGATHGGATPGGVMATSALLALLVGGMLIGAAALRLGFLASFISESVLVGFKSGIGLVIVVDQLPKLLGVTIEKAGVLQDLVAVAARVPAASLATVALSALLVALLIGLHRRWPQLPAPLLVVAAAVAISAGLGLAQHGVAVIGAVPAGLPSFFLPPLARTGPLWPAAVGIAVMSFTESAAAARAFRDAQDPPPEANRELLALGAANAIGACFGAMAAGGGTSQTAVNRQAGARTQLAALVTAATALATLVVLAPVIAALPQAALAVVVVVYAVPMIAPAEFLAIRRVRHAEFRWALVAFLGVVLLGTLKGILVAVILSLVALAQQEMHPPVYAIGRKPGTSVFRPLSPRHPRDKTWPGLLLVRAEGRLFFANAEGVAARISALIEQHRPRVLVLDASALIDLEYTALKALSQAEERLRQQGIELWLAGLNPDVLAVVRRSELGQRLGRGRMRRNVERAVRRYLEDANPPSDPSHG